MIASSALIGRELAWDYPASERRVFVLRAAGVEVGWMRFQEEPWLRSAGELSGGRWTFERTAALRPHVTVYSEDSQDVVAELVPSFTGGGMVSFATGARYCWKRANIWGTRWCFRREGQASSVCLSQQAGPLISGGKVTVCCGAADLPETPVLVLLAWYLRVLDFEMFTEGIARVD